MEQVVPRYRRRLLDAHLVAPDLDDDGNEPFGQIVGFMPLGGVLVVQSGADAGIFSPARRKTWL